MTLLSESIDHLTELLASPSLTMPALQQTLRDILLKAEHSTQQDIETALQRMSALITQAPLYPAAFIAMGCGAFVEQGANPEIASTAILQRTREALKLAPAFATACQNEARKHPSESEIQIVEEHVRLYGEQVAQEMPKTASAWFGLDPLCTASLAVLMQLPGTRQAMRNDSEFMTTLTECPSHNSGIECLRELLSMPDNEEVIVLYPALKRGYRIRIAGMGRNFELHTLLADALIGDPDQGWLPGKRPDPRVVAATKDGPFPLPGEDIPDFLYAEGAFNLYNWQGLQPDGTLPEGYSKREHWIWNEGRPSDITYFEGIRVILLGPPSYSRTWNPGRYFPNMKGEVELLAILSLAQVNDWLARITTAVVHSA